MAMNEIEQRRQQRRAANEAWLAAARAAREARAAAARARPSPLPLPQLEESAARQPVRRIERGVQHEVSVAERPRPAHWFQAGHPGRPKGAKDKKPRRSRRAGATLRP